MVLDSVSHYCCATYPCVEHRLCIADVTVGSAVSTERDTYNTTGMQQLWYDSRALRVQHIATHKAGGRRTDGQTDRQTEMVIHWQLSLSAGASIFVACVENEVQDSKTKSFVPWLPAGLLDGTAADQPEDNQTCSVE